MIGGMDRLRRIREDVIAAVGRVGEERLPLEEAAGRWLSRPVLAAISAPPAACSAMDGYAIRSVDVPGQARLELRRTIFAGDPPGPPLAPGTTDRVFTGGVLPDGADAVVREEAVRLERGEVAFSAAARHGENVRWAGEDVAAGALALGAGERLGARQRALLRAVGAEEVQVRRRARVRVLLHRRRGRLGPGSGLERPGRGGPVRGARPRGHAGQGGGRDRGDAARDLLRGRGGRIWSRPSAAPPWERAISFPARSRTWVPRSGCTGSR